MQGKRVVNVARLAALRRKGSLKESAPAPAAAAPQRPRMADRRAAGGAEAGKPAFDPYKPVLMKSHEGGVVVEKPASGGDARPAGLRPPGPPTTAPAARPPVPAYRRAFAYVIRRPPPPPPPSKPKWPAAIASFLALGLVIAVLATPVGEVFFDIYRHPFYDQFPETARIRVQRTISADIQGGSFDRLGVDVPKPPDIPLAGGGYAQHAVTQPVTGCTPSCPPATPAVKPWSKPWDWYEWDLQDVQSAEVTVLYDYETRTLKWDLHPADAGTVDQVPPPLVDQYIRNANRGKEWFGENLKWKIDPENPVLIAKALEVSRDRTTALEKAQAIYFFLQGSYTYKQGDIGAEPKDAYSTYNDAAGDCDEVSFLFISMMRAISIPAWTEFGVLYDSLQERWVGHAWVQFYLPNKDGSGYYVNADPVNFQWLFRSANRITEWISDGDDSHLQDFYHAVSYQWSGGQPSITEQWKGIEYQGSGVVYNQDTSREIRYVAAPSGLEALGAIAMAALLFLYLARRRATQAAPASR